MKPVSWIIGTVGGGALVIFGGTLLLPWPKSGDAHPTPRVDAGLRKPVFTGMTVAHPITVAPTPKPSPPATLLPTDDIDTRMAALKRLAKSNPAAAARSLDAITAEEERTIARRTVFREWAAISPQDALAWISTMNPEQGRTEARAFVCYRVAEDDPKLAFDLARQAGAETASPLVWDLAQQWAGKDTTSARNWALALPAGEDRDRILTRICYVMAESDPSAAGEIVSREIAAGPAQDEAAMSVLHQWAVRDLDAASEWVAQFPESPLRTRAEAELAGIRSASDGRERVR